MKTISIFTALILSVMPAFGVGNIVIKDIEKLVNNGFIFSYSGEGLQGKELGFSVTSPWKYSFGEGFKDMPFFRGSYFRPADNLDKDSGLIGADGTRLLLYSEGGEKGHTFHISFDSTKENEGYLEFNYYRGAGSPPMLIHVPVKNILGYLKKPNRVGEGF